MPADKKPSRDVSNFKTKWSTPEPGEHEYVMRKRGSKQARQRACQCGGILALILIKSFCNLASCVCIILKGDLNKPAKNKENSAVPYVAVSVM